MKEEEVYLGCKKWLIKTGYMVLAGQPARGIDNLPVIEIKKTTGQKGSRKSYKPDLIAYKDECFYIIECKPSYSDIDNAKLKVILEDNIRIDSLYAELNQYRLVTKTGYSGNSASFRNHLKGVLAFCGSPRNGCSLIQVIVDTIDGEAIWIEPTLPR